MDERAGVGDGIGRRVRAARERLGLTREALAFHAGISWSAIAQVESGRRRNLRPSTLAALSRPLGVSVDYLVDGRQSSPTMLEHAVFPYRGDDQFAATMGPFLAEGLERSEAMLAVTTPGNVELLREHLGRDVGKVEFLDSAGFYTTPGAALDAYRAFFEGALQRGAPWVRVIGEPVWEGRSDSEARVWIRYEALFNLVFAASPVTVICPYDERSVSAEVMGQAHLTHPNTADEGGISPFRGYGDPARLALGLT